MSLLPRTAREIRVAVSGLGKMGTFHAHALQQLAGGSSESYYKSGLREQVAKVRLCGLCDLDPTQTRSFQGIPVFRDHQELLAATYPDIMIIATPSRSHYDLALASLSAGAHTFIEKPATTRIAEWAALLKRASQQNLRLMAGHVERYNPVAIKLRSLLGENALTVTDYTFHRSQPHDLRIQDDIVADKLIHDLDLAMFFFGQVTRHEILNFRQIEGQTRELTLHLAHQNGVTGDLFVSWLQPDHHKIRTCCCHTKASGDVNGDFVTKQLLINSRAVECAVPGWIKPDNNQIKDELADFIGYCLMPDPTLAAIQPLLSPAEVGAATAITEAVATEITRRVQARREKAPPPFKIGVMVESFRAGLLGGLDAAAALGVQGIQFYATSGETHFERLQGPALAEFQTMLRERNLEVSAVCADFGGHGFVCGKADILLRIANTKRIIELAVALGCRIITTHIGVIPAARTHPCRAILAKACIELGQFAYEHDAVLAIETGPEPASVLHDFITQLNLPGGIGVNFDPANLVMVCREDIPAAVRLLGPYIVHTHAKDGINLKPVDAGKLYGAFAGDKEPAFNPVDYILETPLGSGAVPFPAYLTALRAAGYKGYLTVERECGEDPRHDIETAVRFLNRIQTGLSA